MATKDEDVLEELALAIHTRNLNLPGVSGPIKAVEAFANKWSKLTGTKIEVGMGQRVYKLENVIWPANSHGEMRVATPEDILLIGKWVFEFVKESLPPSEQRDANYWQSYAEGVIKEQQVHLWLVDEKPVSIAFFS